MKEGESSEVSKKLTPRLLFNQFDKAANDKRIGNKAIEEFASLDDKDKLAFLEPTKNFLLNEEQEHVQSWGISILENIGGEEVFNFLISVFKNEKKGAKKTFHGWTRFFALKAIDNLTKSDTQRKEFLEVLNELWKKRSDEEDFIQASILILLANEGRDPSYKKAVIEMLRSSSPYDYRERWAVLRALRDFPLLEVAEDIISALRNSVYVDHKFDAIKALAAYPDNIAVVSALGEIVLNNSNYYLRLEAVQSLANLRHPAMQSYLVAALHDENAEIRVQAANALSLLLKDEAVSVIIGSALKEGINKKEIKDFVEALGCIDESKTLSTEVLSKELASEDRRRAKVAEEMLIDLGGWGAIQRLSQRRDVLGTLDKLLQESEERIKVAHEDTFKQARRNFYFAMAINILLVGVGISLVIIAVNELIQRPENIEAWILPGTGGVLSVIVSQYFNNPRRNAREDLATLVNVNVIFLSYLRQINQIDATFKQAYIESKGVAEVSKSMDETVNKIKQVETDTLFMLRSYIEIESKGKKYKKNNTSEISIS